MNFLVPSPSPLRRVAATFLWSMLFLLLCPARAEEGWTNLFDGQSLTGWHNAGTNIVTGPGWVVEDGVLKKRAKVRGGDLLSERQYAEFTFEWEWRIPAKANNGVKYFVRRHGGAYLGHEYQMVDNATMPNPRQQTAAFYDVLPAGTNATPRVGEWNQSRVVVQGNRVEHWLNGVLVLTYECGSPEVKATVARTKFKDVPQFGERVRGHLLLTDHQDECWYRNLRVKEANPGR
jgi:hypothetical protein